MEMKINVLIKYIFTAFINSRIKLFYRKFIICLYNYFLLTRRMFTFNLNLNSNILKNSRH